MPIVIPYTDGQIEFAVNMHRFARTLLCADGPGQFATCLVIVQPGDLETALSMAICKELTSDVPAASTSYELCPLPLC